MARTPSEHLIEAARALACLAEDDESAGLHASAASMRYTERILRDVAEELRAEEARARYDDEAPRS